MGGKASLFIVVGFGIVFLVAGVFFGNLSTNAVDNSMDYFIKARAHNIAVSGINMGLNELFKDSDWRAGYSNLSLDDGTLDLTVTNLGFNLLEVISKAKYGDEVKVVKVKMKPSSFAKFAWYVGNMSSKVWVTGDTVWGPFHSQSQLNIAGDPVYYGKVTSLKGISPGPKQLIAKGYDPKFNGGYESGVDIPLPNNYQFTKQKASALDGVNNKGGSSYFSGTDLWLEFQANGNIVYRTGIGSDSAAYSPPDTMSLSAFAPNGVIYLEKGNIYMSGTVNGNVTVVSGESSGTGHGNVYLNDDVVYSQDPMIWDDTKKEYVADDSATDLLGILASNNVRIMDNDNNNKNKDIRIDASIFCAQGGFELENKNMPASGSLYLRGGVIAAKEEILAATDASGIIKNGYKKHVIFDRRLLLTQPVDFPVTDSFEIVSWYE